MIGMKTLNQKTKTNEANNRDITLSKIKLTCFTPQQLTRKLKTVSTRDLKEQKF